VSARQCLLAKHGPSIRGGYPVQGRSETGVPVSARLSISLCMHSFHLLSNSATQQQPVMLPVLVQFLTASTFATVAYRPVLSRVGQMLGCSVNRLKWPRKCLEWSIRGTIVESCAVKMTAVAAARHSKLRRTAVRETAAFIAEILMPSQSGDQTAEIPCPTLAIYSV
jgi:hypothetical protein